MTETVLKSGSSGGAKLPVAVIGAGPSGLPTCKALGEAGIDYECLEAGSRIGGVWNLESQQTGAYRSLHTNTSTKAMSYSDFPFNRSGGSPVAGDSRGSHGSDGSSSSRSSGFEKPRHLSAAELQRYFEAYADHFELDSQIRLQHRVEEAEPLPDGTWQLRLANGETRCYSALIVATGQYAKPRWPQMPSSDAFSGDVMHVFDYFDPATPVDLRERKVLVVGLGSSAAEVAAELSDPNHPIGTAGEVHLSARSGRWVLNKMIDGRPIDASIPHPAARPPKVLRMLPDRLGVGLMRRAMKLGIGRMVAKMGTPESLGLPRPTIEPWEDRPTMSLDFIDALRAGRIHVHPGVQKIEGDRVSFTDGTAASFDAILYATGYQLDFPYLSEETLGCEATALSLYQQIAHQTHDTLFFVGCLRVGCSMWPVAEQQARWIAKALSGKFTLPVSNERARRARSLAGSLPVMCNFYIEQLRREAGGL